jgi:hypothetical protein
MLASRRSFTRSRNWVLTALACLAMAAQLVVALAPLSEGRVARALSAHVEAGGPDGHVAHNEATCASCQARSIHGATSRPATELPNGPDVSAVAIARTERAISTDLHFQSNPRAPPAVI